MPNFQPTISLFFSIILNLIWNPVFFNRLSVFQILAVFPWIPAFAGMTRKKNGDGHLMDARRRTERVQVKTFTNTYLAETLSMQRFFLTG